MHNNPVPVAIGIIPSIVPGEIILIERSEGGIALPGGYVDELEDAVQAVNRECFEEVGLKLDASEWQLFHSAVTPDNKLLLFSRYRIPVELPPGFVPNEEVRQAFSACWTTPLKFDLHEQALRKWAEMELENECP